MRKAWVLINDVIAGELKELSSKEYHFTYQTDYRGLPISLTMPTHTIHYEFNAFPTFFEGLLPEGIQLEAILRKYKLDKQDYFGQLIQVGNDMIGAITVKEIV